MEYLDRLKQSLNTLEDSANKLERINILIEEVVGLTEEVKEEKESLSETQKRFNNAIEAIEKETESVNDLVDKTKHALEETVTVIKEELLHSKKEQIEAVESISTLIGSKISVANSDIQEKISNTSINLNKNIEGVLGEVKQTEENITLIKETVDNIKGSVNETNTELQKIFKIIVGGFIAIAILVVVALAILYTK